MQEHANPIEFLIEFAWANGADRSVVNNAKDELNRLKEKDSDTERWLSCEKDLKIAREKYISIKTMYEQASLNTNLSGQG